MLKLQSVLIDPALESSKMDHWTRATEMGFLDLHGYFLFNFIGGTRLLEGEWKPWNGLLLKRD